MARPGTKPKPTALKKLAGNPGRRALNEREPQYDLRSVRVPRGRLNADGKRIWRSIAPRLADVGLLTEVDKPALEMMCLHYQVVLEASRIIEKRGIIALGSQGQPVAHPAVTSLNTSSTAFRRWATEFGLTPSSRTRLQVPPDVKEPTLVEQLLNMSLPVSSAIEDHEDD